MRDHAKPCESYSLKDVARLHNHCRFIDVASEGPNCESESPAFLGSYLATGCLGACALLAPLNCYTSSLHVPLIFTHVLSHASWPRDLVFSQELVHFEQKSHVEFPHSLSSQNFHRGTTVQIHCAAQLRVAHGVAQMNASWSLMSSFRRAFFFAQANVNY